MHIIDLNSGPLAAPWRENTIGSLYELAKRAPGEPLTLLLGRERLILLQDMQQVRHVLREAGAKYRKNFGGFAGFFGESRFTSDGERWEFLQSLSQPHISAARPGDVVASAASAFGEATDILLREGEAGEVVVDAAINQAAAKVISDVAFGNHGIDVEDVLGDFREVLRFGSMRNWNVGGASVVESTTARESYARARHRMAAIIEAAVVRAGHGEAASALIRDIEQGRENGVDPVEEIASLLFAGFDTTAAAIGWGLFLLAAMPDLQSMLREKIRQGLAGQPPSLDKLDRIPELSAFQNEVLRMFPPVPMLGRIALSEDNAVGVPIAEGQRVILSIIGMHHDARRFPKPAQVRLSRYEEGKSQGSHMAFGMGRRGCAGSRIANLEMATGLAVLIPAIEFSLADQAPIVFDFTASMRRRGGHRLLVKRAAP